MGSHFAIAVVFLLTGVLLLFVGYLIRYRRMTHLISGYDPERVHDEEGLARWVGGWVLLMGGLAVAAGLGVMGRPGALMMLTVLLGVLVLALTATAAWGARRFEK